MAENAANPVFSRDCGTFPTFSDISEFQPIFHLFSITLFLQSMHFGELRADPHCVLPFHHVLFRERTGWNVCAAA
ncbi:MAG: hypothetical protein IJA77_13445 [Clostridia bacterium]|nr:hypothetical protein [Clostridia bacterium]